MRSEENEVRDPVVDTLDLFVVHAEADADFVHGYLLPALDLPLQRVLLLDKLPLGSLVVSEIDRGVARSRFTIVVLSPAYLDDRWAMFGEQLASYLSLEDTRVIPLRRGNVALPLRLEARISLDFTEPARWESEVQRLRDLLRNPVPAVELIPCPYPGMRGFAEVDADRFFGRDEEIEDLVGRLDRGEREIYVIGPSGSGKSSLVQAGLLHRLRVGTTRLGQSFLLRTMRPGERPTERFTALLDGDLETPAVTIAMLMAHHRPAERLLVFVDQLEELFTLADPMERHRFIAVIRALRGAFQCHLILALRADFYGMLMDSELWPEGRAGIARLDVAPLRGAALAEAIAAPSRRVGVRIEARLCDRLVADAATEPGALPLLQETLRLLWDRRHRRFIGLAEYEELGASRRGLDVAIARRAGTTMDSLTMAQRAIARRVLVRLISFGEGRTDTRRQQPVRALQSASDDPAEVSRVLQRLADDRLITLDSDEGEGTDDVLADLSHEALIAGWPAFQEWLAPRRADEQQRRRLEAKVAEWIERGRGTASLLDPAELSEAEQWMRTPMARELGYGPELPALVAASRNELGNAERQRRKRVIHTFAALAVIAMAALIFGLLAWQQRRAAQSKTRAEYLLDRGQVLLDEHPMQALPYLVAAREAGMEGAVIRASFVQTLRNVPLVTLLGHRSDIIAAAFSPDGARVVTASWDKTARVWDATTGKPVTAPLEHQGAVFVAAFSPDGTRVVTASRDKTARVWDATTGKPVTAPLEHQDAVVAAAFSADGLRVVTASTDKTARVWNATTGKPVFAPLQHQGGVTAAVFSADGMRVITASGNKTVRVWDATTGRPITEPLEHQGRITTAAFSADGVRVVMASEDETVRVWDTTTGKPVTAPLEHLGSITVLAFSPDGTRVVTASDDQTARVWDAVTSKPVTAPLKHQGRVTAAAFSADGTRVVTVSDVGTARVWEATTGEPVTAPLEHDVGVRSVAFSADGTRVVTASPGGMARIWDVTAGMPVIVPMEHRGSIRTAMFDAVATHVVTVDPSMVQVWDAITAAPITGPLKHRGLITTAAFSADGTRVVTASWDKTARVWDAVTGEPVTAPLEHQRRVIAAALSVDGRRVVTGSDDKTARVWDATTGQPVTAPLEHRGIVRAVAFSADGKRVATGSNGTARVWNAMTGEPVTAPLAHDGYVTVVAFSPDGARLVTASEDRTARIWDAATGEALITPLEHHGIVEAVAFNPDGTRLVTASDDKTARVWDTMTGAPVTAPLEHQDAVTAIRFSPDGTRVVTVSKDSTARVWDVTTGVPVTMPLEHRGGISTAAFSSDGRQVVTVSSDNTVRQWPLWMYADSLDDWRLLARCSPFAVVNDELRPNLDPARTCRAIGRNSPARPAQ